jgi:hypothetical protein
MLIEGIAAPANSAIVGWTTTGLAWINAFCSLNPLMRAMFASTHDSPFRLKRCSQSLQSA